MLNGWPSGGIWLSSSPADMRCSFDGLSALVRTHLRDDPVSDRWYVFINRRRTHLKVLGWESGGFWIWSKRLEQGLFEAPDGSRGVKSELTRTRLLALIDGMDLVSVRQRKRYRVPRVGGRGAG